MATAKPIPDPAPRVKAPGPAYPTSKGGSAVKPATDRGETKVGGTHCAAKRKLFQTGTY